MKCVECYWLAKNSTIGLDMVCCNKKSGNYNKIFSKEDVEKSGCDCGESKEAVDYRTLTPWQFASKYYN